MAAPGHALVAAARPHVPLTEQARATWEAFIQAHYHREPSDTCILQCSEKKCKRFFCVECRVGGLCEKMFEGVNAPHDGHHKLHVYKTSGFLSVRKKDLPDFLNLQEVAEYKSNEEKVCYLRTREATTSGNRILCAGCHNHVSNAKNLQQMQQNVLFASTCSIECLLDYDLQRTLLPLPTPPPGPKVPPPSRWGFPHRRKQSHQTRSPLF